MITVNIEINRNLEELCSIISKIRNENTIREGVKEQYPKCIINLLSKVKDLNAYRYWGSRFLYFETLQKDNFEMKLLNSVFTPSLSIYKWSLNKLKESHFITLVEDLKSLLNELQLKNLFRFSQINVKLIPLFTCPPPQLGRFGISYTEHNKINIILAFGCPEHKYWNDFNIDTHFFLRGCLHYITKEWIGLLEKNKNITLKHDIRKYLIKLIPIIIQKKYNLISENIDSYLFSDDRQIYKWSLSHFDYADISYNNLLEYIVKINNKWPPYIYNNEKLDSPKTIIELIQNKKYTFKVIDEHNLLKNKSWIEDVFILEASEKSFEIVLLPWGSEEATLVKKRNDKITYDSFKTYIGNIVIDESVHLLVLIDYKQENKWRLVFILPKDNNDLKIAPSVITQMYSDLVVIDRITGRKIY